MKGRGVRRDLPQSGRIRPRSDSEWSVNLPCEYRHPQPSTTDRRSSLEPASSDKSSNGGSCAVCGDRSNGFHYKAMACEGCKGFFRRSVNRGKRYRCHCLRKCDIDRRTRTRCRACRFQKCLRVGMSVRAVRKDCRRRRRLTSGPSFDTPPSPLTDDASETLVERVLRAHRSTRNAEDFRCGSPNRTSATLEDGGRRDADDDDDDDLSVAGIFRVLRFCERVPGFASLCRRDREILLKHACVEIMVLRFCARPSFQSEGIGFPEGDGTIDWAAIRLQLGPLADPAIDVARSLVCLSVDDTELALLQAVCLLSSARPGLTHRSRVRALEDGVSASLAIHACRRRADRPTDLARIVRQLFRLRAVARLGSRMTLTTREEDDDRGSLKLFFSDRAEVNKEVERGPLIPAPDILAILEESNPRASSFDLR